MFLRLRLFMIPARQDLFRASSGTMDSDSSLSSSTVEAGRADRREFLKRLAVLAGSSALTAELPWWSPLRAEPVTEAASDRVRLGLVGVGTRGNLHISHLLRTPGVEIAALCDDYEPHLQAGLARVKGAIGSGVIYQGHVYTIDRDGIAACLDLKTGEKVWEERLKGPGARGSSWSSMLLANGKIYVPNQSGDVFVLRADTKFEVLATNSLREPTNASLAASDGDLFMRTDKSLWCLAAAGK